ncbi:MAG: hypothetical protein IPH62_00735 [Ignavibacteriae bacterium]|nr:hypothetical protein [Ignavibacteriota bacterium]
MKKINYFILLIILIVNYSLFAQNDIVKSFDFWDAKRDTLFIQSNDIIPDWQINKTNFLCDFQDSSIYSYQFDLNNNNLQEHFYTNEFLCGSGGCPWLIIGENGEYFGEIFGKIIKVLKSQSLGFYAIETYERNGAESSFVTTYKFDGKVYKKISCKELKGLEIENYFK